MSQSRTPARLPPEVDTSASSAGGRVRGLNDAGSHVFNLDSLLVSAASQTSECKRLKLPWEKGNLARVFSRDTDIFPRPPMIERVPNRNVPLSAEACEVMGQPLLAHCKTIFGEVASARLRAQRKLTNAEEFELVYQRFELVLSHNYQASSLGRQIAMLERDARVHKVGLALGGKALLTLRKRLRQASFFVRLCTDLDLSAFPISEQSVSETMEELHSRGAPASVILGVAECANFLHHVLGVDMEMGSLTGPVVRGIARSVQASRPRRKQARPVTVREVEANGECGYIDVLSLSHKMRGIGNRLGLALPLVAPAKGLGPRCWGKDFERVADLVGRSFRNLKVGDCILPTPDASGQFTRGAISTSRFAKWAVHILKAIDPTCGEGLTGQSAKRTTLAWLSKAGASLDDRSLLGRHQLKGRSSVLTYSRDALCAPLRVLDQVLADIRNKRFYPDEGRSGVLRGPGKEVPFGPLVGGIGDFGKRVPDDLEASPVFPPAEENTERSPVSLASWLPPSHVLTTPSYDPLNVEPDDAVEEHDTLAAGRVASDSSSESSEDSDTSESSSSEADERLQACGVGASLLSQRIEGGHELFQHRKTHTLHRRQIGSSTGKFICGRVCGKDHKPYRSQVEAPSWLCKQCQSAKPLACTGALLAALDSSLAGST